MQETRTEAQITQLRSEKQDLEEQLRETKALLEVQSEGWRKEQNKTLALGSESYAVTDHSFILVRVFP